MPAIQIEENHYIYCGVCVCVSLCASVLMEIRGQHVRPRVKSGLVAVPFPDSPSSTIFKLHSENTQQLTQDRIGGKT